MRKYIFIFTFLITIAGASLQAVAQDISTIAGAGTFGFSGDGGPATIAQVQYIWHVVTDVAGNAYVTDNAGHRIRKVTPAGAISTFAGNGLPGSTGDGGQATAAQINGPSGIAIDAAGNIIFADALSRKVRKIDPAGIITTIAGTGVAGFSGDGGPATAATLNQPYDLRLDHAGNIYIADFANHRVRRISTTGIISTVAGNGVAGFLGDGGQATAARLSSPSSIALDNNGNLYIGDMNNNRIRKVTPAGVITTIAGAGGAGFSGDGGPAILAKLNQPLGVAVDAIGNVIISDQYNHRIRKVDDTGGISTIVGTGAAAFGGDGGPASAAQIKQPFGISLDSTGDLFICDWGNFRLRQVSYHNHQPSFSSLVDSFAICENDLGTSLDALLAVTDADTAQILRWKLLAGPLHGTVSAFPYLATSTAGTVTPTGIYYNPAPGYSGNDTIKVRVDDGLTVDTVTIYARIKPIPNIAPITGGSIVCIGTPVTLSNAVPGGIWSRSNANATITTGGVVNGVTIGKDTIWYTRSIDGCSASVSKVLSIYPVKDSIAGVPAVCKGLYALWTGIPAGGTWTASNGIAIVTGGMIYGVSPGKDTITYTVTNPCGTSTFTKVITVNDPIAPVVFITASPSPFITPGQTDTLHATITGATGIDFDYQWQKNGTDIPGATDSTYISSSFADGDSLTCIVTNGPCAAASFGWIYIVWVGVGVTDLPLANGELIVVPNPNNGSFELQGLNISNGAVSLRVTDMLGRVVYETLAEVEDGQLKRPVAPEEQLGEGTYLLNVATRQGRKVVRFTVTR